MEILILLIIALSYITTIKMSTIISENLGLKEFLTPYNKGYKVDLKTYSKYIDKLKNKTYSEKRILISKIILLIPIINILFSTIVGINNINKIMKDEVLSDGLIPMTEEEKKEYKKYKTDKGKVGYLTVMYQNDFKNEKSKPKTLVVKKERLIPLSYTYEEVKKLIEKTQSPYVIGKIDWANVAIIGMPKVDEEYNKIIFNIEGKEELDFKKYSEEEAADKKYLVYPFTDECEELVQKTINEIIHDRFHDEKKESGYNPFPITEEKPKIIHHIIK